MREITDLYPLVKYPGIKPEQSEGALIHCSAMVRPTGTDFEVYGDISSFDKNSQRSGWR